MHNENPITWALFFKDTDPDTGLISQVKIVKHFEDMNEASDAAFDGNTFDEAPNREYAIAPSNTVIETSY